MGAKTNGAEIMQHIETVAPLSVVTCIHCLRPEAPLLLLLFGTRQLDNSTFASIN